MSETVVGGIHRISVPTPFEVGRVNAYLIEDRPLTLIDSGPNSIESLGVLEQGLEAVGHTVAELELLIVTHQHLDHFGLARTLARRSGAEVAALAGLDSYLESYKREARLDDRYAATLMLAHGVAPEVVEALEGVSASYRGWGAAVAVTRSLTDGETVELQRRSLEVLHRPGHSPSDTLFLDREEGVLLGGDHLIAQVSSNPLLTRPLGADPRPDGPRPQALVAYMASLRRTRELDLKVTLPGHGDPIADHVALIDQRLRMHERRARKISELIAARPRTAHEIAREMWTGIAVTQAYLTLSEVLGHVDLLVNAGDVVERERDGVVWLEAV